MLIEKMYLHFPVPICVYTLDTMLKTLPHLSKTLDTPESLTVLVKTLDRPIASLRGISLFPNPCASVFTHYKTLPSSSIKGAISQPLVGFLAMNESAKNVFIKMYTLLIFFVILFFIFILALPCRASPRRASPSRAEPCPTLPRLAEA